jgi:hypothetical protein
MSLEAAITANTAVLEKVAALLAEGNKTRSEALAGAAAVTTGRKTKDKPGAAATTPAVEPAKPPAAAVADKGTGSAVLDAIVKELGGAITVEHIRNEFGGYMGVTEEAERAKRKANVAALLAEICPGSRATEMKEEDRPRAIFYLRKFAKGETVDFKADIDAPAPAAEEKDDLL